MIDSFEAQQLISRYRPDNAVVIATMTAHWEWPQVSTNPDLDLPIMAAMGKASSLGLGLALARPDLKVIVLDGDGCILMNLGSMVTIANMAPCNLIHFVFENGVYRTTGGQPVPGVGKFSFVGLADAAGYARTYVIDEPLRLAESLPDIFAGAGPTFVCLKITAAMERPHYPSRRILESIARLKTGLETASARVQP